MQPLDEPALLVSPEQRTRWLAMAGTGPAVAVAAGLVITILAGVEHRQRNQVAEFEAARLRGLELVEARQEAYDAIRRENGKEDRLQINGLVRLSSHKPGQRMGRIDTRKEVDAVLLALMDEGFNAIAMNEAGRAPVINALVAAVSKARNKRGALGITKFRVIAGQVWPKVHGNPQ